MAAQLVAVTEGDADRVIVERMLRGLDPDVYPKRGTAKEFGGKSAAIKDAARRLRAGVGRLVLALDINGGTAETLTAEVERSLRLELGNNLSLDPARPDVFHYRGDSTQTLCLWPIGLRGDPHLTSLGIQSHSVEDLLIKSLHHRECLDRLVTLPPNADPWGAALSALQVMRAAGFALESSKSVLHVFQAIIGFRASSASLADDVVKRAEGTPAAALLDRPADFPLP